VTPARLVVLISGTGSNLQALIEAAADPGYGALVCGVVADRDGIAGLDRAADAHIPAVVVAPEAFPDRAEWNRSVAAAIGGFDPDLVVSAGFMRLLGAEVLDRFDVVNTHPALLPAFPGAHAVTEALRYGVTVSGCTVHWIDAGVDTGPVIAQAAVPVLPDDDEASLHERIKTLERPLLVDVVGRLAREGWTINGRRTGFGRD
jgi:phosphoribosylglycinamide formyltransferase-1